jgi:hypothetical protein
MREKKEIPLGQLGPDFLRFLWGLADYAAHNQVPVELQDFPHLDLDSPSLAQAAFQLERLRSLIHLQVVGLIKDLGSFFWMGY